jgi:hypothetical protein
VPLAELLVRLPGAAVFFVLLVVSARGSLALVAWALAFVPPYVALMTRTAPDALATAAPSR